MTRSSSLAMQRYSIEQRERKYVKGYGILSSPKNVKNNIQYKTRYKTRCCKNCFQKSS